MLRVLLRCGYVQEARYRRAWPVPGGEPVDSMGYAILRQDWEGRTTDGRTARWAQAAVDHERVADRLEQAARHLRRTAEHFRDGEVPRACAHVVAAQGLLSETRRRLDALAELHASRSEV